MAKAAGNTNAGSTARPGDAASASGTDAGDPFGVTQWLKDMPGMPIHPLLSHPTAAMAAATAIGLGLTGQIAGAMLGAMQGAMETLKTGTVSAEKADPGAGAQTVLRDAVPKAEAVKRQAPKARATAKASAVKAVEPVAVADTGLKQISGIGPKLEQALHALGINGVAEIAGWSAKQAAKMDDRLGLGGRIARDDWVGQAKALLRD